MAEIKARQQDQVDPARGDALAMQMLAMARDEISARMGTTTQILTLYVGAVGAMGAWVFGMTGGHREAMAPILFPMGAVVAFFSFAASWIIQHSERMVNALARYQRDELAPYLAQMGPQVTLWECSTALRRSDGTIPVVVSMSIWAMLLCGPDLVAIGGMMWARQTAWAEVSAFHKDCFWLTCLLTLGSLGLAVAQIWQRNVLRREGDRD